jgi:hypothetical protein
VFLIRRTCDAYLYVHLHVARVGGNGAAFHLEWLRSEQGVHDAQLLNANVALENFMLAASEPGLGVIELRVSVVDWRVASGRTKRDMKLRKAR